MVNKEQNARLGNGRGCPEVLEVVAEYPTLEESRRMYMISMVRTRSMTFSGDNTLPSTGMPVMNNASERQKRLRKVQDMRTFTIGKLECQGSKYKLALTSEP